MSDAESIELPPEVMADLNILSGGVFNGSIPTEPSGGNNVTELFSDLQAKFIDKRSKSKTDYTIENMEVKVFDLTDTNSAIKYSEFVSEHLANMMSNPSEYKFSETPVQFVPNKDEVKALVIVKAWKQVKKMSLIAPKIDIIPKTN